MASFTDRDNVKRLTRMADVAGFEALVPVARWRGFGGTMPLVQQAGRRQPYSPHP